MKRDTQGRYVTISTVGEKAQAFVPAPLPPHPPIEWTPELRSKFDQALLALGRLDSVSTLLPDTSLFLYMYVRKEAVLSSMIEGTQSSLADLLLCEQKVLQEPMLYLSLYFKTHRQYYYELLGNVRLTGDWGGQLLDERRGQLPR